MHQHYLKKLYDPKEEYDRRIELLSADIFKTIEPNLQGPMSPTEAKNYKKLLSAIQKAKILHQTEISVLFVKANRFLGKDAIRKEKALIKREIQEKIIMEGPRKSEDKVSSKQNSSQHSERQIEEREKEKSVPPPV